MRLNDPRQTRVIVLTVVAFVVIAAVLVALDLKGVRQVISKAEWHLTLLALLFSIVSDLCLGYAYVLVNKAFSIELGSLELLEIGFVSSALNNIVSFLGAAGHTMRVILLGRRGVESEDVIAASVFHSYINNIMMLVFFVAGLVFLLVSHVVYGGNLAALAVILGMLVLLLVVVTGMVLVRSVRSWVLHISGAIWHFVSHRDITLFITNLDSSLARGLDALRMRPLMLIPILGLMAAEWALAAGSLWFCFDALGRGPNLGLLLSGFSIGISAGNLSMLPGGLGAQEASMAGVFALLGIPFAQAALASILFRLSNNFVPFFVSLALYWGLVRRPNP